VSWQLGAIALSPGPEFTDWAGRRIQHAAEQGLIVLQEHGFLALKNWGENSYDF